MKKKDFQYQSIYVKEIGYRQMTSNISYRKWNIQKSAGDIGIEKNNKIYKSFYTGMKRG